MRRLKSKLAITVVIVLCGCVSLFLCFLPGILSSDGIVSSIDPEKECKITSNLKTLTKYVGDKFNFVQAYGVKIEASDKCNTPTYASSNVNLVSVDFYTSDVECLQEGSVVLYVKVGVKNCNQYARKGLALNILKQKTYPKNAVLEHQNVTISAENSSCINKLIMGETTEEPNIFYQNNFVEYDWKTGEVSLKTNINLAQTVTDKVTIKIPKSEDEFFELSFDVTIEFEVENFVFMDDEKIAQNGTVIIRYDNVLESNDSLVSFTDITIKNEKIAKIVEQDLGYLIIKGLQKGSTTLAITNGNKTIIVKLIVG